jgi:hypothetical protein
MSICRFVKRLKLVEEIQGKLFSQIYSNSIQNKKEVNKLGSSRAVKRMCSETITSHPGTHFSGTTNTS